MEIIANANESASYLMIEARLEQLTFGSEDSFNAHNMKALFDQAFASITAGLAVTDYQEVEQLAIRLVNQNTNCCYTSMQLEDSP